jgi:hypothetical protein
MNARDVNPFLPNCEAMTPVFLIRQVNDNQLQSAGVCGNQRGLHASQLPYKDAGESDQARGISSLSRPWTLEGIAR